MKSKAIKKYIKDNDKAIAVGAGVLSVAFVLAAFLIPDFFDWVFARHENELSWYIRPLFLIPFCLFAFYRSYAGISVTILALLTSMMWFPQPAETSDQVKEFLTFEKDYLLNDWTVTKAAISSLVPLSMAALAFSFWRRSIWLGFATLSLIAILKIGWSVVFGGESGQSVIVPAIIGLLICGVLVWFGLRRSERKQ